LIGFLDASQHRVGDRRGDDEQPVSANGPGAILYETPGPPTGRFSLGLGGYLRRPGAKIRLVMELRVPWTATLFSRRLVLTCVGYQTVSSAI
jgi:hypothetical protein